MAHPALFYGTTNTLVLLISGVLNQSENAVYWYFVVGIWLPVYAVVYVAARLL
jgi:hypothetical protein